MASVAFFPVCREMSELATDYMEDVLAWRPRASVWLHLRRCTACRRYYAQMRATARLPAGQILPGPEAAGERRILDRVIEAAGGRPGPANAVAPDGR